MELLNKIFAPRQMRALKTLLTALIVIAEMLGVALFDLAQTPRSSVTTKFSK